MSHTLKKIKTWDKRSKNKMSLKIKVNKVKQSKCLMGSNIHIIIFFLLSVAYNLKLLLPVLRV